MSNISNLRLNSLTSTRFFAAMFVLAMHFSDYFIFPDFIQPVIRVGGIGVTYFFILSGFVLYYSYGSKFEQGLSRLDFKNFFIARFFRIYPAYLLSFLLVTIVHFLAKNTFDFQSILSPDLLVSWLTNLFAFQSLTASTLAHMYWNAPSWSISTEFAFYLAFPFFVRYFVPRFNSIFLLLIGIILFMIMWSLLRTLVVFGSFAGWFDRLVWVDYVSDRHFLWRIWEFFVGIFVAKIYLILNTQYSNTFFQSKKKRDLILFFSIFTLFFIAYYPWPASEMSQLLERVFRLSLFNVVPFAVIIIVLASGKTFLSPLLENKYLIFLGEISYSIYIYHWIFWLMLQYWKDSGQQTPAVLVAGCVLATIGVSVMSFVFFENPVRRWGTKHFISKT